MKKALACVFFVFLVFSVSSAQDFWHIKAAPQAIAAFPMDGNGAGFGTGAVVVFGYPNGNMDIGFEMRKWWRNYNVEDTFMARLSRDGWIREGAQTNGALIDQSEAKYNDNGLSFAMLLRYKFLRLSDAIGLYSGGGLGLYMIQVRRDEARQLATTGFYQVLHVDYYLETKGQLLTFLGLEGKMISHFDYYGEGRVTYIPDWHKWDDPIEISAGLGIKYSF